MRHKLALIGVLCISAFLNFFALAKQDYFEYYYVAAVKSMLTSWHNFFFASFDPGGFLAIDKPPLGFWIQALSVKLIGYSAFSILLPEALAGVLAVVLIFHLVGRVFGPLAGLIAALVLALSPMSVIASRNNIVDSLLVLTVLLAAWMMSKAVETGRLRWLCLCGVLIGLGFNIKYLQAYMVLPALGLVYLLGASARWRTKFCHLALALGILLLLSLSWAAIVDLTAASQRPYIDSDPGNSELDLAFGYNGAFRLNADNGIVGRWVWEIGRPGITRFFEQPVAGQSSWLLPLALLGLLALCWQNRWSLPLDRRQQALVLWGTWLFTMLAFFSNAHFFHLYYLSMLAPAIAAMVGAGGVTLWQDYICRCWRGWLLPGAVLVTVAAQTYFLAPFPQWGSVLAVGIIGLWATIELMCWRFRYLEVCQTSCDRLMAVLQADQSAMVSDKSAPMRLGSGRMMVREYHLQRVAAIIAILELLSLLAAPLIWSVIPLSQGGRAFPMAGPAVPQAHIPANLADPALIDYLLAHRGKAQFLLATTNSEEAAPFIIDTGQPVMALGGYGGSHSFLTREQLVQRIDHGSVRFFLLSWSSDKAMNWVTNSCGVVPTTQWQSPSAARFLVDGLRLYDCAHRL